jgi:hypothetical protein
MLAAIVSGEEMLLWEGAGIGPVLVVDLEQGTRSIKRALRETKLDERDDVLYVSVPDGLALDQEREHLLALIDAVGEYRPVVVLLDPYYKAHRADDPNAERPIIDLMRTLDSLRAAYGFALILPAHPRKDVPGREGFRKLTIHDVAGSGAVTRGVEIVLGIERLGPGAGRLRYLKDRDGDLPVGEAMVLLYDRETGFRINTSAHKGDEDVEALILAHKLDPKRPWLTVSEWGMAIHVRDIRVKAILEQMVKRDDPKLLWFAVAPPGRAHNAHCYTTSPEAAEQSGAVTEPLLADGGFSASPLSLLGERGAGVANGAAEPPEKQPEQQTSADGSDDPDYPFG